MTPPHAVLQRRETSSAALKYKEERKEKTPRQTQSKLANTASADLSTNVNERHARAKATGLAMLCQ
jgi:hypothetical protein